MKKFRFSFASALVVILTATLVWAGVTNFDSVTTQKTSDDTYIYRGNNSSGTRVFSVDGSGNIYTAGTLTASTSRRVNLPLTTFLIDNGAGAAVVALPVTSSATPYLARVNSIPALLYATDTGSSAVFTTFRVPTDYSSGGSFVVSAHNQVNQATNNKVDFDVYVQPTAGGTYDAAATNQTPVSLADLSGSRVNVTLTPSTDFASLVAGDWVTFRLWRDTTAGATGALYIDAITFSYTASR